MSYQFSIMIPKYCALHHHRYCANRNI